jgi:hypothetical protein
MPMTLIFLVMALNLHKNMIQVIKSPTKKEEKHVRVENMHRVGDKMDLHESFDHRFRLH